MINSVDDLKKFIEWCKSQKIKAMSVDNVTFEFSDLALVDAYDPEKTPDLIETPEPEDKDEDMLFWSAE